MLKKMICFIFGHKFELFAYGRRVRTLMCKRCYVICYTVKGNDLVINKEFLTGNDEK